MILKCCFIIKKNFKCKSKAKVALLTKSLLVNILGLAFFALTFSQSLAQNPEKKIESLKLANRSQAFDEKSESTQTLDRNKKLDTNSESVQAIDKTLDTESVQAMDTDSDLEFDSDSDFDFLDFNERLSQSLTAKWRPFFEIKYFNDETATNTAITRAKIYTQINWDLNPSLSFYSKALFIGQSGTTSSLYDRVDQQKGLNLLSAFFTWKKSPIFWINFGNIQQGFLQAPLLVTDTTFSSLKVNLSLDPWFKKWAESLVLLQLAIPSNAEQVQTIGQIIKGVPLFGVTSFQVKNFSLSILPFDTHFFNYFNLWFYYNIPPAVAFSSSIYGNSIRGQKSDSGFLYDFYGIHNHWILKSVFSSVWAGDFGYEYIKNFGSPPGTNQGDRLHASLYYNYQNFVELKGTFEYFKNQTNSAIAFYNSELYGHNNRKGFLARIQFYFYKSGVSLGAFAVFSQSSLRRAAIGNSISASIFLTSHYLKIR